MRTTPLLLQASLFLALPALALDKAAPVIPSGPVPISAPVLSAMSFQLGELSKLGTQPPTALAMRLSSLARAQGTDAATSSAASALLIKQALSDPRALKTLFASLQEAGAQGVAASHSLADLRESVYGHSTPDAVKAALQWTMGPLEEKLNSGKSLDFASLAAVYDGAAPSKSAEGGVLAEPGRPGENGKIVMDLRPSAPKERPAQAPIALADPSANRPPDSPITIEGDFTEAFKTALLSAANRVGTLPAGVQVVFRAHYSEDNPQVQIVVDGRQAYWEYLYHSKADLARLRLKWNRPGSWLDWLKAREASPDLSQRIEAALRLAVEGAPVARARFRR